MKIDELTEAQLISSDFYKKLYESEVFKDPMTRGELKYQIQKRAKDLKIKTHVDEMLRTIEQKIKDDEKASRSQSVEGVTRFEADVSGKEYTNMYCGSWIATEDGIQSQESSRADQTACYHPILPIKRMRNQETSEEQITLAFKRGGKNRLWNEITVPKDMIANARSITTLAKYGIGVTSETSRLLVKYLSDVENNNDDIIPLVQSSSKLGWHGTDFLPYDDKIIFDATLKAPQLIQSITENGSYDVWLNHAKTIRSAPYIEPRIALAASFSSVLIKFLGIASVIVDFCGLTESGKTVMLMLATSVWACPDEGLYMGDFLTTDTELEVRADILNNLPLILDDTAKMRKGIKDNIEQVIYNLSSGSGKKRSNKELGSERVRTWKNTIIVNGESPLNAFVQQGGAINRIIEVSLTGERLFDSPQETAGIVRENYGFAGKMFVEEIKNRDISEIKKMHSHYCKLLTTSETMQKQVLSMGALLTADKLATEIIFNDNHNLSVDEVKSYLTSKSLVSDGSRCYEYLIGVYQEKGQHFDIQFNNIDQWGEVDYQDGEKYINFFTNALNSLCKEAGYTRKAFTIWAKRNGLLRVNGREKDRDRDTFLIKKERSVKRVVSVKVVDLEEYECEKDLFS